jgi:hypothetical protein
MASLRFLLGMLPGTAKFENASDKLRSDYHEYKRFESSEELKQYQSLESEVTSSDFKHRVKGIKSLKFKGSAEYSQEKEYLKLLKSKFFVRYQKLSGIKPAGDSKEFQELKTLENSWELKRIAELEKIVKTDKFYSVKRYLSMSPKERYEQSEEYKKQKEYDVLRNSEKIIWFKKIKKKYPFADVEKWDVIFEEKFEGGKLDGKIWMTRYLTGDKLLKKGYVLPDDKHAFNDGKNVEIRDKRLRIVTKREKAKSLVWNPALGFYEKEFEFTSDMVSSAKGFRGRFGIYEAKVRVADSGVTQGFSLMTGQILPHVDIFRFEKGKLSAGNFWNGGSVVSKSISSTPGNRYTKDFYIYSLEWHPGILIWKINGVVFKVQRSGVPEDDMYMMFNSSLKENAKETGIPSSMDVDWIRVLKKKD